MSELNNIDRTGQLLRHARRDRVAIKDQELGITRTYGDVLDAVLCLRAVVQAAPPSDVLTQLEHGEEVYVGVLAAGGYEFAIAALTVLALGAALVPIFPAAPLEEVVHFASKSQQVLILTSVATTKLAHQAAQRCQLLTISILPNLPKKTHFTPLDMPISSNAPQDPSAPGVVIFTYGTTGKPKGAVLRRTYTHEAALAIGDGFGISHNECCYTCSPSTTRPDSARLFSHSSWQGLALNSTAGLSQPSVLKRLLNGGITVFSAVPTIYMRFKWHIEQLPRGDQLPYKQASKQFRAFLCGSSALQDNVQDFWTATRGQPILTRYGATEIPGCLRVLSIVAGLPKGCVSLPVPGVELKISSEGELLVKSPNMFAKYLGDSEATRNAQDEDGWYRTGDIVRQEGDHYFIFGRASVDIIKSGGYKISAPDVERECLSLPYVTEAMVVGVEDEEFGQRVGTVLVIDGNTSLTMTKLRADLTGRLAGYKLPTVLRVATSELPKGATGKFQKKVLGPKLLPSPSFESMSEVQVHRRRTASGLIQARM